ncbi:peptidase C1A, partial [Kipferlia bialata]
VEEHMSCAPVLNDQGTCGSCWAMATEYVFQARYCHLTGQTLPLSYGDLVECDHTSCYGVTNNGCSGGHFLCSFDYTKDIGMTTEACVPYKYHRISYPYPEITCEDGCAGDGKPKPRHKSGKYYRVPVTEEDIMVDIYENGPLATQMKIYADFYNAGTGIYEQVSTTYRGGHAVSFVGWGTEEGKKYWIVANSWGLNWGDKGYFRILRGTNEVGIEAIVAGIIPQAETEASLSLVSPTTGTIATVGGQLDMRWESTGNVGDEVDAVLIKASSVVTDIGRLTNDGQEFYTIPEDTAEGANYRVRITRQDT